MSEKYILTKRELHLGHIKETFGAGAVIEHDIENNRLIVDGRKFEDTRDLDILKRQALKSPHDPWMLPYSEETLQDILGMGNEKALPESKKDKVGEMEIIQSDADLQDSIDIRDTQVSKRNNEAKEEARTAAKNRDKNGKMEVIRGDEGVNERLDRLKGKNDLSSIAERSRLKEKQKMEVVEDDGSCSMTGGSKGAALNAGQHLPSRDEVESKTEQVEAQKEARRKEIESKREAAGVEGPEGGAETTEPAPEVTEAIPETPETVPEPVAETSDDIDAQIAALQAKKTAMEDGVERTPVTESSDASSVVDEA